MTILYRIIFIIFINLLLVQALLSQNQQKIDSLQILLQASTNPVEKVDILTDLSNEFINNYPDKALAYVTESNDISHKIKYTKGIIISNNILSWIYLNKGDIKAAAVIAEKAKALAEKQDMKKEITISLLNLGNIYNIIGLYDKSSEYLFKALKISEKLGNKEILSRCFNMIGSVFYSQQNFDKAFEYYTKDLNICKELNQHFGIASALNNLGAVYQTQKKYKLLEQNIRMSLKISTKIGNKQLMGINYANLGQYFSDISNIDTAMFYYQKALLVFSELKNIRMIGSIKCNIAQLYLNKKNYSLSLKYSLEVLKNAQKYGFKTNIFKTAKLLNEIYTEKEEYKNANKYLLMQYNIRDSLNLDNKLSTLSKMEMIYQSEKEEQIRKDNEQKKNLIYIIFTISLIFIFVLTITIIFNRNRIKSKNALFEKKILENDLELKNKEMTSNVMSLMKKNELLVEISKKLSVVEKSAYRNETKATVRQIAKELQDNTNEEIWHEFKVRFEDVHKDYYNRLLQLYPDLWPSEQRLCAFLRLNMTTKEISELTGQSVATLEKARYRLRKKLEIPHSKINLVTFLSKI